MTEVFDFDQEAMFKEILERGRTEGVSTQEAYNEFVEFVVQEKLQVGEADPDQDLPDITKHLQERWEEYQSEVLAQ